MTGDSDAEFFTGVKIEKTLDFGDDGGGERRDCIAGGFVETTEAAFDLDIVGVERDEVSAEVLSPFEDGGGATENDDDVTAAHAAELGGVVADGNVADGVGAVGEASRERDGGGGEEGLGWVVGVVRRELRDGGGSGGVKGLVG